MTYDLDKIYDKFIDEFISTELNEVYGDLKNFRKFITGSFNHIGKEFKTVLGIYKLKKPFAKNKYD